MEARERLEFSSIRAVSEAVDQTPTAPCNQFDRCYDFGGRVFWTIYASTDRPRFHSVRRVRDQISFPVAPGNQA
jgi:hypothetical protein